MSELDLTEAIEAGANAIARRGGLPGANDPSWRMLAGYPDKLFNDAAAAIEAAVPMIERAVREQASAELRAWADEIKDPGISGPRAIRRRTLMSAASKILPKLSPAELAAKLASGEAYVIHCTSLHVDPESEVFNERA